ncbi:hypothetical protein [Mucilaginibacter terrae]|uniref:Capsule polysaccharide biosynthesis protein n=1 Tax=Mucilaginibacter terrae TaxID=1955052 RepID=A0ABU3GV27_9SPHI|nr:hypothetical protein [Mucilaginibacter terrae]MDT3403632.1 hypothetical protein [Mucilaginibacter terrae]
MGQKCIIISCIPNLTPLQEAGMLQMLNELKNRGLKVFFYSPNAHELLNSFAVKPGRFNRILYKYYYYKSRFLIEEDKWKSRLKWWYSLQSKQQEDILFKERVKQAIKLFCTMKPDMFVCWNPNAAPHGVHNEVAHIMGIKTGGIDWGLLPNTYILDSKGTLAMSEIFNRPVTYPDEALVERVGTAIYNNLKNKSTSMYAQETKPLPPEAERATGPKILLLGIDTLDSAAHPATHNDRKGLLPFHTSTYEQALAFAQADPSFTVIFKPHPSHNVHTEDVQVQNNMWVLNINPDYLIDWADVVVCNGSKMELSVLFKGKPLINVGAGLVYKKGCSYEVYAPEQMVAMVTEAKNNGFTPQQQRAFKKLLGYLKHYYLYSYGEVANNTASIDRFISTL